MDIGTTGCICSLRSGKQQAINGRYMMRNELLYFLCPMANNFNGKAERQTKSNRFPNRSFDNKGFDHHDQAEQGNHYS
jgi:hypothetical protein